MCNTEKITNEYNEHIEIYKSFTLSLERLLTELIALKKIRVHSVSSRIKNKNSLIKKIKMSQGKYSSIWDITDISGVRIITYFEDDVDKIGSIIENEFLIDRLNSIDKRKLLDPDRFGYLSLHYVISISKKRWRLAEYDLYQSLGAEIQVRSLLQHAWAEIEHDLGYKGNDSIPKTIWRKFYRLSGLLEIADQEFINIRKDIMEYQKDLPEKIHDEPGTVALDGASLREYIMAGKTVPEMDRIIIERYSVSGHTKRSISVDDENIDKLIKIFQYFGLKTIVDIDAKLIEEKDSIFAFAEIWQKNDTLTIYQAGKTLEYYIYIHLLKNYDKDSALDFLTQFSIKNYENINSFAENLFAVLNEIRFT